MLPINKKLKLISIGLGFSIFIGLATDVLFSRLPEFWNLTKKLDIYFYNIFFSSSLKPSEAIVIIDSNDPQESRSRSEFARMIRLLDEARAKCIGFDIRFQGYRNYDPQGDEELVRSVAKCSQVVLPIDFTGRIAPSALQSNKLEQLALSDTVCKDFFIQYELEGVDLPFPELFSVTKHIGHINAINNEYYHFPPVIHFEKNCYPFIAVELVRLYLDSGDNELLESASSKTESEQTSDSKQSHLRLTDIPRDEDEQVIVNFISVDEFRPLPYSWHDAIELLQSHPEKFLNKIVLIVNSAPEAMVPTPLGPYPRWAIIASVASQLLQNSFIEASVFFYPALFSFIIIFLCLIWLLFITPRMNEKWRKTHILFITGNGLLFFFIFVSLRLGQQWMGVIIPMLMFNVSLLIVRKIYTNMIKPAQYLDFGIAILEHQRGKYPIQIFESPVGEEEEDIAFQSLQKIELFQETLQKIKARQASKKEIKWIGDKLFDALFQPDIFNALRRSMDIAKSDGKNIRLKLRIDAPELVCLPWELAHSAKLPPGFVVLNKHISLIRYLPLAQPVKKSDFRVPLKILVVISSPSDLPQLEIKEETKLIKKALRSLVWGGDVRLRLCENASLDNLRQELEREPDVIHYIGHSYFDPKKYEAFLYFESSSDKSEVVDAETVGNLLYESSVKLVVLNSCEGATSSAADAFAGVAQNLVRVGIPAVLAMQFKIPDKTALWFSNIFYSTLLINYSIDAAVAEARRYIMSKTGIGQQDWATPVLFMRSYSGKLFNYEK